MRIATVALLLLWGTQTTLRAEGSKEFTDNGGNRAYLAYRNDAPINQGSLLMRTYVKVYTRAGETLNLGSSANGLGAGSIRLTRPDGTTTNSPAVGGSLIGVINNRSQETNGPLPNTGGYNPWTVTVAAGQTGIWGVEFISPNAADTSSSSVATISAASNWTRAANQPNNVGYVLAWDVTVRTNNTTIPGRAYLNKFSGNMAANGINFNAITYVVTRDGFRYQASADGIDPYLFHFFVNNKGFRTNGVTPLFRSVDLAAANFQDPEAVDTTADTTAKMFFNPLAADLPVSANIAPVWGTNTWLNVAPTYPLITAFDYIGADGSPHRFGSGVGGTITFNSSASGTYRIELDLNGNNVLTDPIDVILQGPMVAGSNAVPWDGKDGQGNPAVASGNPSTLGIRVTPLAGEVHFPYLDAENNPNGLILQRLNGNNTPDYLAYWNDLSFSGGTAAIFGTNSASGVHRWSALFGDLRGMDTWAFAPGAITVDAAGLIIQVADLQTVSVTPSTSNALAGGSLTYTLVFRNNGPDPATNAAITGVFPVTLTNLTLLSTNFTGAGSVTASGIASNTFSASVNLASNAVVTFVLSVNVQPGVTGSVTNFARILRGLDAGDPNDPDAIGAGNNSITNVISVSLPVLSVAGTVFEDLNYGGGAGRDKNAAGVSNRPSARVELYNWAGNFVAATNTSASGQYTFTALLPTNYTLRVVNSSVSSSRPGYVAGLLPVQTFRTDASGGSVIAFTNHVGGEDPTKADPGNGSTTLIALASATNAVQSLTAVTLSAGNLTNVNFGFNFDTIVNTNDTGQGSLRQFVANANALGNGGLAQVGQPAGKEVSIFMISDGLAHAGLRAGLSSQLSGGVAVIRLNSTLPDVIGADTTIDGTTQTANVTNSNPVVLGTGGNVGVDAISLGRVNGPEVQIISGTNKPPVGLILNADNITIRGIATYGFGTAQFNSGHQTIRVAGGTGYLFEQNVIGASAASFTDPRLSGGSNSVGNLIDVQVAGAGIIRSNLIGYAGCSGIGINAGVPAWTITQNEFRGNSVDWNFCEGIVTFNIGNNIGTNLFANSRGSGVDFYGTSAAYRFVDNTVTNSGLAGGGGETGGIEIDGNGALIARNIITGNSGAGVLVRATNSTAITTNTTGITITQNSIFGNGVIGGIGIDLLMPGDDQSHGTPPYVTPNGPGPRFGGNRLQNFPVLSYAYPSGGNTVILGTFSGTPSTSFTLEFFVNVAPSPSGYGEGQTFTNAIVITTDGAGNANFTNTVPGPISVGTYISSTATSPGGDTSEFSLNVPVANLADVAVGKLAPAGSVYGTNYNYILSVTNFGPSAAANIYLTDNLPAGLTFISAVPAASVNASNQVIWANLGNLAAGAITNLTLTVSPVASGSVTNTATGGSPTLDPNSTNNLTPPVITTISKASPLVVWPVPTNIVYGTVLGTNQNNATSGVPGSFVYSPTNGTVLPAGTNVLSVVYTPGDTNYAGTNLSVLLVVVPAPLGITANGTNRVYGAVNPVFTYTASGFVNGENAGVLGGSPSLTTVAGTNSPVGSYAIVATNGTLSATNYGFNFTNGLLTVTRATPVVGWPVPTNIVYGTVLGTNQNSATSSVPGNFVYSPTNGVVLRVGTNVLSVVYTPGDTNYLGQTLTNYVVVVPAPLTVTAGNQGKVYGTTLVLGAGQTNFTASGLVSGDSVTSVTLASLGAVSNAPTGSYALTVTNAVGAGLTNYSITYVNGVLTVGLSAPLVVWPVPTNIVYGTVLGTNQNNATSGVPGSFVYSPTNGTVLPAGTNVLSVVYTPGDTNYAGTNLSVLLVVVPAPLGITANGTNRVYGAVNPVFTYTASGFVNGENAGVLGGSPSLTTVAGTNSPVGSYAIVATNGTLSATNYGFNFTNGLLTVTRATPVVGWPVPTNIVYGTVLGTNQNSATSSVPGNFVYSPTNGVVLRVGTNVLSVVYTPGDTNYLGQTLTNYVVVVPAPLTVTAGNQGKVYGTTLVLGAGQTNFTASGLVSGDSVTSVTLASLGAVSNAPTGSYALTVTNAVGAGLTNYSITYVNGVLTVGLSAPLVVWPVPTNIVYGTVLGTNQNNATSGVPGSFVYSPTNGTVLPAGTNVLSVVYTPGDTNYAGTNLSVLLVVVPAPLTVTAGNQGKVYGTTLLLGAGQTNFTASGLVSGDSVTSVTLASAGAASNAPTGSYAITVTNAVGSGLTNYNISYVSGTLSVLSVPPTANAQTVTTTANTPSLITLTGSDPNSLPLTFAIAVSPAHGSLSGLNTNTGTVTYTPAINYYGPDSFTFVVRNGATNSTPATVSITVATGAGADVQVFLSGPTLATVGDAFSFTTVVSNGGPLTAVNTLATNLLPSSLVFASASGGGVFSNGLVTWPVIASLTNGRATNLTVTVKTVASGSTIAATANPFNFIVTNTPATAGPATNRASAYASTFDPNVTNNSASVSYTNAQVQTLIVPGVFSVFVATNTYPTNVIPTYTVIPLGTGLFIASTNAFNPQTQLYEEFVTVTNIGQAPVHAVRLSIGGLRSGVTLYNATGTNNGVPYVEYDPPYATPLNPYPAVDSSVRFVLEFFVADRRPFTNTLTAVAVQAPVTMPVSGTLVTILQAGFNDQRNPGNPRYLLQFTSIPGRTYTIQYSDDSMVTWNQAVPSILASATSTFWYDDGPPVTLPPPLTGRLYRVLLNP